MSLFLRFPTPLEISSLRETLERLVSDEELRRNTGTKARDWASASIHIAGLCVCI